MANPFVMAVMNAFKRHHPEPAPPPKPEPKAAAPEPTPQTKDAPPKGELSRSD